MKNYSQNKLLGFIILLFPLLIIWSLLIFLLFMDHLNNLTSISWTYLTYFNLFYFSLVGVVLLVNFIPEFKWIFVLFYLAIIISVTYQAFLIFRKGFNEVSFYPLAFGLFTTAVVLFSPIYLRRKIKL